MALLLSVAILLTAAILFLLHAGDPKRLRSARLPGKGQSQARRRLLAAMASAPGLLFVLFGQGVAFLIWLGACAVIGWLVTVAFSDRGGPIPARTVRRRPERP